MGYGKAHLPRIPPASGPHDPYLDKLGSPLAIHNNHPGQLRAYMMEHLVELLKALSLQRPVAGHTVGKTERHVIGTRIPIYCNFVKRLICRVFEYPCKGLSPDNRIC